MLAAVSVHREASMQRFVETKRSGARENTRDAVLYLGVNTQGDQESHEAGKLRRTVRAPLRHIIPHGERDRALGADHVRLPDRSILDLGDFDQVKTFANALGLEAHMARAVADVIHAAPAGGKDELAGLAVVWSAAERGHPIPGRLVLSGHSVGDSIFDGAGELGWVRFADVFALARAMPQAAAQIEDVMLSACNTGHRTTSNPEPTPFERVSIDAWREHFPQLKTVWAYAGERDSHSPTGEVALKHIEAWEKATRGGGEKLEPKRALAEVNGGERVGYDASVSVWTVGQGYRKGRP